MIPLHKTLFCGSCRGRLPAERRICHPSFPYLLGAATDHEESVRELIHALKFAFVRQAAEPLAEILIRYTRTLPLDLKDMIVVPVPLARRRLRERGFNQSELIARRFADHLGLPLEAKAIVRTSHKQPQWEIRNFEEKRRNVAGCFSMVNPEAVRRKKIFLIDDVTTSGATLFEAAKILKAAGSKTIVALAVAMA